MGRNRKISLVLRLSGRDEWAAGGQGSGNLGFITGSLADADGP